MPLPQAVTSLFERPRVAEQLPGRADPPQARAAVDAPILDDPDQRAAVVETPLARPERVLEVVARAPVMHHV
ncbi:MAG: hypothetical protein ACKVOG_08345 [Rhodoglobus sp.]